MFFVARSMKGGSNFGKQGQSPRIEGNQFFDRKSGSGCLSRPEVLSLALSRESLDLVHPHRRWGIGLFPCHCTIQALLSLQGQRCPQKGRRLMPSHLRLPQSLATLGRAPTQGRVRTDVVHPGVSQPSLVVHFFDRPQIRLGSQLCDSLALPP